MDYMIKETDYIAYFDSLLKGDKKKCIQIVSRISNESSRLEDIYMGLIQRSMYRIGDLWDKGRISIAEERIASDISLNIIDLLYPKAAASKKKGLKVLITCIDKEHHSIGARMVSDLFELNGWDSTFIGPCVPHSDIMTIVRSTRANLIGISSNFYINVRRLIELIEEIKKEFPLQEIIVGGQIFSGGGEEILRNYKKVSYAASPKMLEKYLKRPPAPNAKKMKIASKNSK